MRGNCCAWLSLLQHSSRTYTRFLQTGNTSQSCSNGRARLKSPGLIWCGRRPDPDPWYLPIVDERCDFSRPKRSNRAWPMVVLVCGVRSKNKWDSPLVRAPVRAPRPYLEQRNEVTQARFVTERTPNTITHDPWIHTYIKQWSVDHTCMLR